MAKGETCPRVKEHLGRCDQCAQCVAPNTHMLFFPVDLLSQSHYSRRLPEPEGSSVNFKAPPPTPWKTGASVHENTAGGCICAVPVPSSVQQGNKQGGDTLKTLASHGVHGCVCMHVYVCVCVCNCSFICNSWQMYRNSHPRTGSSLYDQQHTPGCSL